MALSVHIDAFSRQSAGVVAVSGGPDSVALLHLCRGLVQDAAIPRVVCAHVNHQLRGEESDADDAFVLQLAQSLDIPCRTTRIDVAAIADREHANLESVARRERYAWLAQVAREENAAWIATGHTADDQAETVLFRLLRGSGIAGLGGIPERRPLGDGLWLIRPLLAMRRQAVHEYLHERNLTYRVDSSNRDLAFTRNRLRLELMPLLEKDYNPGVVDVLCRLAEQAQELSSEIVSQRQKLLAEAELPRAGEILVFACVPLEKASANLVREMFRHVWVREGWPMGDMDFASWHRLAEIAGGERAAWDFPGGIHARRAGKVMQVHGPKRRV